MSESLTTNARVGLLLEIAEKIAEKSTDKELTLIRRSGEWRAMFKWEPHTLDEIEAKEDLEAALMDLLTRKAR
jgi:hypothetical protein